MSITIATTTITMFHGESRNRSAMTSAISVSMRQAYGQAAASGRAIREVHLLDRLAGNARHLLGVEHELHHSGGRFLRDEHRAADRGGELAIGGDKRQVENLGKDGVERVVGGETGVHCQFERSSSNVTARMANHGGR